MHLNLLWNVLFTFWALKTTGMMLSLSVYALCWSQDNTYDYLSVYIYNKKAHHTDDYLFNFFRLHRSKNILFSRMHLHHLTLKNKRRIEFFKSIICSICSSMENNSIEFKISRHWKKPITIIYWWDVQYYHLLTFCWHVLFRCRCLTQFCCHWKREAILRIWEKWVSQIGKSISICHISFPSSRLVYNISSIIISRDDELYNRHLFRCRLKD